MNMHWKEILASVIKSPFFVQNLAGKKEAGHSHYFPADKKSLLLRPFFLLSFPSFVWSPPRSVRKKWKGSFFLFLRSRSVAFALGKKKEKIRKCVEELLGIKARVFMGRWLGSFFLQGSVVVATFMTFFLLSSFTKKQVLNYDCRRISRTLECFALIAHVLKYPRPKWEFLSYDYLPFLSLSSYLFILSLSPEGSIHRLMDGSCLDRRLRINENARRHSKAQGP